MISADANLIAVKLRAKVCEKFGCPKAEISEKENRVFRLNVSIPVFDHLLVHFINRLKGSSSITNDVCVRKVSVRYEPFIHIARVVR